LKNSGGKIMKMRLSLLLATLFFIGVRVCAEETLLWVPKHEQKRYSNIKIAEVFAKRAIGYLSHGFCYVDQCPTKQGREKITHEVKYNIQQCPSFAENGGYLVQSDASYDINLFSAAVHENFYDLAKWIFEKTPKQQRKEMINALNTMDKSSIHYVAGWKGQREFIQKLLDGGGYPNGYASIEDIEKLRKKDHEIIIPLGYALVYGDSPDLFIEAGANPNIMFGKSNKIALHYATMMSNKVGIKTITMLLDAGSYVDFRDKDNRTPLHYAVLGRIKDGKQVVKPDPKVVELLLSRKASPCIRDKMGNAPYDYAKKYKLKKIETILSQFNYECKRKEKIINKLSNFVSNQSWH
jgi:hypothetical protein